MAILAVPAVGLGLLVAVLWGPGADTVGTSEPLPVSQIALSDGQLFLPHSLDEATAQRICGDHDTNVEVGGTAGIGPHHLPFSAPVLWKLYADLAAANTVVTRIILLGPDHNDAGAGPVTSAAVEYETSLGRVRGDPLFVEDLIASGYVTLDSGPLTEEHAIYSHIPYIRRFFPEAALVPVLFRSDVRTEEAAALGHYLSGAVGLDTLVILSSDLSHYRSRSEAETEDVLTVSILRSLDGSRLMDARFDARPAARALFSYLADRGVSAGTVLCRSNSADLGGDSGNTTGYAGIVY